MNQDEMTIEDYGTHYHQRLFCKNCQHSGFLWFRKGTLSNGIFECPNCACMEYRK